MTDLKSMTPEELTAWCREQGQPAFRGRQLFQWLSRGVVSTQEMTDLPKALSGEDRPGGRHFPPVGGAKTGLKTGWNHKISLEAVGRQLH